jgi:hemerythrin superfamily protein
MAVIPTDDIVALLEQDHAAVQERLLELENADPSNRALLFRELTMELSRHEVAEETVVYPAIRDEPGGDVIADARRGEESGVEKLMAHIERLDPTSEEFRRALGLLRSAVIDHAVQEETQVFPLLLAHQDGAYLTLLGQKFRGEKVGAPTHRHPHLPNSADAGRVLGPFAAVNIDSATWSEAAWIAAE